MKRIIINIGEIAVSREPAALETILGSCVAVCLWDDRLRIGGLNHYLLPHEQENMPQSTIYGGTSIDTLIRKVADIGADIRNLQAQIFGGGSVITDLEDLFSIGVENVRIAQHKLQEYGIPIVSAHVRARQGIRVIFRTLTGEITVKPLGRVVGSQVSGSESAAFRKQTQLCRSCICCGTCADLAERRKRKRKG